MPNIQLVIFDMAGTTVHDDNFVNICLQEALKTHGIEASRAQINTVMGYAKPVAIKQMMEEIDGPEYTSEPRVMAAHDTFLNNMLRFYREDERVKEIEGASQTFEKLHAHGIKVALDTGFSRDIADVIIGRLGWKDVIDASVTSDEVERGRPHPDMAHKIMDQLGITDGQAVAKVGDTLSDLQEGTAVGCQYIIGVLSGANTKAELETLPHTHIIGSVAELPETLGLS